MPDDKPKPARKKKASRKKAAKKVKTKKSTSRKSRDDRLTELIKQNIPAQDLAARLTRLEGIVGIALED